MYMKIDHFYQFAARRRHFELPENPIWRGIPNPNRNYPDVSVYISKYLSTTKNLRKSCFYHFNAIRGDFEMFEHPFGEALPHINYKVI